MDKCGCLLKEDTMKSFWKAYVRSSDYELYLMEFLAADRSDAMSRALTIAERRHATIEGLPFQGVDTAPANIGRREELARARTSWFDQERMFDAQADERERFL
jgi:hypothetical protein